MRIRSISKQRRAMLRIAPAPIRNIQITIRWCQSIQRKPPLAVVAWTRNATWAPLVEAQFPAPAANEKVAETQAIARSQRVALRRNRRLVAAFPLIAAASPIQARLDN